MSRYSDDCGKCDLIDYLYEVDYYRSKWKESLGYLKRLIEVAKQLKTFVPSQGSCAEWAKTGVEPRITEAEALLGDACYENPEEGEK